MLIYWAISSMLFQNYSALFYMNFKHLIISDNLSLAMAHFINRIVLYPVFTIMFLNYYITLPFVGKKLVFFLSYIALLNGLEWLAEWLRVLKHIHWKLWWSFSFWLVFLLISIGFMKFFRMKLQKEVKNTLELYDRLE
jgi:hypothetical protein